MPEFEPFPILEQGLGLYTAKVNWRSPAQSYRVLENLFINNGRLTSRAGMTFFGKPNPSATETLGNTQVQSGNLVNLPVQPAEAAPSTYAVTFTSGGVTLKDDGLGDIRHVGPNTDVGDINYLTGAYSFTWPGGPPAGNVVVTYEFIRDLPIVGIFDFFPRSSNEFLVVCDTKRIYVWNDAQMRFFDLLGVDTFTGTESDYFWFVPFDDRLIFCNGVNVVFKYEPLGGPPQVVENPTNFDPGVGGNDLDTAKMGIRHKGMLHYLYTKENGVEFPQRARRTKVGDPTDFRDVFAFTDCPTDKAIQSAVPVGDSIIVFFERNETWRYRFTNDPKAPYAWERISRERGSWCPFAAVEIDSGGITLDGGGLVFTDGQRVQPMAPEVVETFPFPINVPSLKTAYGIHYPERQEVWITLAGEGAAMPNTVLVISTKDGSFTELIFTYPISVLGFYRNVGVVLWDDITDDWDDVLQSFDSFNSGGVTDVAILGGTQDGFVYKLNQGLNDDGGLMQARARTQFFSPYETTEAHFGYVDLYMDPIPGKFLNVNFFRDRRAIGYYQVQVPLTQISGADGGHIIRRINVNQISDVHGMELTLTDSVPGWRFFGMVLYMKPIGPLKMRPKVGAIT